MKVDRIFCNGEALSSYTRVTPFVSERDVILTFVPVISLFHHDLQKRTVTVLLWYRENVEFGWSFLQTRKTQRPGIEQTAINVWGIYLQHREYFVNVKFKGSGVIPPLPLADPRERQEHAPSRSIFFIFMQFSIKIGQNKMKRPVFFCSSLNCTLILLHVL